MPSSDKIDVLSFNSLNYSEYMVIFVPPWGKKKRAAKSIGNIGASYTHGLYDPEDDDWSMSPDSEAEECLADLTRWVNVLRSTTPGCRPPSSISY